MSTSVRKPVSAGKAFVPGTALAAEVTCDAEFLRVRLTDGRLLAVPLAWFPRLADATPEQRAHCEIAAGGRGLHWPALDEDLSIAGLMAGGDWQAA